MINFCVHHQSFAKETYGISTKKVSCTSSFIELTLLICGILMIAKVGAFQGASQVNSFIVLSAGGLALLVDITQTLVNSCNGCKRTRTLEATGAKVEKHVCCPNCKQTNYNLNLKALYPQSPGKQTYIIRLPDEEKDCRNRLGDCEFFFYSVSRIPTLIDITLIWKSESGAIIEDPFWGHEVEKGEDSLLDKVAANEIKQLVG
jgi:hypothetical protein